MGCEKRIDRALQHALHLPLNTDSRYAIISDCHRGEGTMNDNFLKNQNLFFAALSMESLERFGFNDPTSAARNYRKAVRYEKCLEKWVEKHNVYLMAGHSHRPHIPFEEGEKRYLNTGSCVHPGCITAIEVENMQIPLVKWRIATRRDMSLYVTREVISGPINIE